MSSTTPNLNLIKPAGTDFVNVADLNSNFDIIDTKFGNFTGTVADIKDSVSDIKNSIKINLTGTTSIGSYGYVRVGDLPTNINKIISVMITEFNSISGAISATATSNGIYLIGTASATITGAVVTVRYYS